MDDHTQIDEDINENMEQKITDNHKQNTEGATASTASKLRAFIAGLTPSAIFKCTLVSTVVVALAAGIIYYTATDEKHVNIDKVETAIGSGALNTLDRTLLISEMAKRLPVISGELGTTPSGIAERAGLDAERVRQIVSGKRKMKWSEYMSILFVLWDDEKGQELVERCGLFPDALKNAMSTKRPAEEKTG
ncbi:MAG: hypothetical protein IJ608_01770 [Lachnospiraceae bacterium]|nr:hypothetical protein [Lachnospiraceae bacterium]